MEDYFILIGIGAFIVALALDIGLVKRRRPWLGWLVGLLPILFFGIGYIIPPLTCKSDNPVGCEWAGIGAFFIGGLTILMLAVYSLLAAGITRAHRPLLQKYPEGVPYRSSLMRSLGAVTLLSGMAIIGVLVGWGLFKLVETGVLIPWRNQGTPPDLDPRPGERAVAFKGYDLGTVQITTSEGRVFETHLDYCNSKQRKSQNCWYYGSRELSSSLAPQAEPSCRINFWVPNPPESVTERVETSNCMFGYMKQTVYVLRSDGSVWAWHHETRRGDFLVALWVAGGALAGMIIGVLLGIKSRNGRKQKSIKGS